MAVKRCVNRLIRRLGLASYAGFLFDEEALKELDDIPEVITFYEKNGTQKSLEVLDIISYQQKQYVCGLTEEEDDILFILQAEYDGQEIRYVGVGDEAVTAMIFEIFKYRHPDMMA